MFMRMAKIQLKTGRLFLLLISDITNIHAHLCAGYVYTCPSFWPGMRCLRVINKLQWLCATPETTKHRIGIYD